MRVNWRGKDHRLLYVGTNGGPYDFSSISSALDSIKDAAEDNRYLIVLARNNQSSEIVFIDKGFIALHGEDKWTSIVERPSSHSSDVLIDNGFPLLFSGGTVHVAPILYPFSDEDDGNNITPVTDVEISNLRIVRNATGNTVGGGAPPEAALFVGAESRHPEYVHWDRVLVTGCVIEGVHDGIQWFGQRGNYKGDGVSRLVVTDNIITAAHDASTQKGQCRTYHARNHIRVNATGVAPHLDEIGAWKHTGFHLNMGFGQTNADGGGPGPHPQSQFVSHNDVIEMAVAGKNRSGDQKFSVGFLFYNISGLAGPNLPRLVRIINPSITIESSDVAADWSGHVLAGVAIDVKTFPSPDSNETDSWRCTKESFSVVGGSIEVDATVDDPNCQDSVYGVRLDGGDDDAQSDGLGSHEIGVFGTRIRTSNAKTGGNAYSLGTVESIDKIVAEVVSDQPVDANAGTIISAAAEAAYKP